MIGKMLSWLQESVKRWSKPVTLPLILGLLSYLTHNRADLMIENEMHANNFSYEIRDSGFDKRCPIMELAVRNYFT